MKLLDWRKEFKNEDKSNKVNWCFHPNTCPVCGKWSVAMHMPVKLVGKDLVCHTCLDKE